MQETRLKREVAVRAVQFRQRSTWDTERKRLDPSLWKTGIIKLTSGLSITFTYHWERRHSTGAERDVQPRLHKPIIFKTLFFKDQ